MTPEIQGSGPVAQTPRILVVDDDRRVVELLELALSAQGFQVLTAADGEEALRRALDARPDLIVLDVRLPRKSGLEVCEALRRDPDESSVPIILVSAAVETETRLQAFARGADDYLSKPFSPKELVARVKRLLVRSGEARESKRRARQLEHELARAQEETRRARREAGREQSLRELAFELGRELHRTLDVDELAARFLAAVQSRLGSGLVALLGPDGTRAALAAVAVRGDGFQRVAGIEIRAGGEMAALLDGLARPMLRRQLERFPELETEIQPLVASGVALVAPLRGPDRLEGLLIADERADGAEFEPAQLEILAGLCDIAAVALHNARRVHEQTDRMLALIGAPGMDDHAVALRAEAAALVDLAARHTLLPPRQRSLLAHAVRLGAWTRGEQGRRALETLEGRDPTARIAELRRLLERGIEGAAPADETLPDERRTALLLSIALRYAEERAAGRDAETALGSAAAQEGPRLDAATHQALVHAQREASEIAGRAA